MNSDAENTIYFLCTLSFVFFIEWEKNADVVSYSCLALFICSFLCSNTKEEKLKGHKFNLSFPNWWRKVKRRSNEIIALQSWENKKYLGEMKKMFICFAFFLSSFCMPKKVFRHVFVSFNNKYFPPCVSTCECLFTLYQWSEGVKLEISEWQARMDCLFKFCILFTLIGDAELWIDIFRTGKGENFDKN